MNAPNLKRRQLPGSRQIDPTQSVKIVMGTRAGMARVRKGVDPRTTMVAPLDLDPFTVEWPVKDYYGVCVLSDGASEAQILRLVQALLVDGAAMICVIRPREQNYDVSFHYGPKGPQP